MENGVDKVNFDGDLKRNKQGGIGIIARDSKGKVIASCISAFSFPLQEKVNDLIFTAGASQEGTHLAAMWKLPALAPTSTRVIIELHTQLTPSS